MALKLNLKPATTRSTVTPATTAAGNLAVQAATEYRNSALEFDRIKAELAVKREALMSVVGPERDKELRSGNADTSIKIPTLDGNRVMVVYQERFRGLSPDNKQPLQDAFGKEYLLLVDESESVGFRKDVDLATIEATIGKAAATKLMALLDVKEAVTPKKGAFEAVARYFAKGEKDLGEDLLTFVEACISEPQVRAK